MAELVYLDSSAIVKLVVAESETGALRRFLRRYPSQVTSGLARTEVVRAVRRHDQAAGNRALQALRSVLVLAVSDDLLESAGMLDPVALRTLDAIHLASARSLGSELVALVTYDDRMASAATTAGLPVQSPR